MATPSPQPLSSLAQASTPATGEMEKKHEDGYYGSYFVWWILWFVIIVIIIWLILIATKPTWVQKTNSSGQATGELDNGKALLWAIVGAFIVCIIVWIIRAVAWGGYGRGHGGHGDRGADKKC